MNDLRHLPLFPPAAPFSHREVRGSPVTAKATICSTTLSLTLTLPENQSGSALADEGCLRVPILVLALSNWHHFGGSQRVSWLS